MAVKSLRLEGNADISLNDIVCICGHCNEQHREGATIEFNFKAQKVFFYCDKCQKMNEISLAGSPPPPLPRTVMR
jgi:hypothetical protein